MTSFQIDRLKSLSGVAVIAILASGCVMGPDYVRPSVELPTYIQGSFETFRDQELKFWGKGTDPELLALLDIVLKDNLTIKAAAARVDIAYSNENAARSSLYPALNLRGSFNSLRSAGASSATDVISIEPALSWTPDLWGRVRRQIEAAGALSNVAEEGRRAVVLIMVGQIASTYIQLRASEAQLAITQATVKRLSAELDEFKAMTPPPPLSMTVPIQSFVDQVSANIFVLMSTIEQAENRIRQLCARPMLKIQRRDSIAALRVQFPSVPKNLRSDSLSRRPDVAQAEQILIANNAGIGAAKALYFPQIPISISGGASYISLINGRLPFSASPIWSAASGLASPIFNGGAIAAQVAGSEAATEEAAANYRNAFITAYTEVKNALINHQYARARGQAIQKAVATAKIAIAATDDDNGYVQQSHVATQMLLEQNLYTLEIAAIQAVQDELNAVVRVYQDVGGSTDYWAARASQPRRATRIERVEAQ